MVSKALGVPQCSDDLLRSVSLPSHPHLLAEKLQTSSILTLHLVSFQGVRSRRRVQALPGRTGRPARGPIRQGGDGSPLSSASPDCA